MRLPWLRRKVERDPVVFLPRPPRPRPPARPRIAHQPRHLPTALPTLPLGVEPACGQLKCAEVTDS